MSINGKIAELVLRAQNASDGGKRINEISRSKKASTDNHAGYAHKDPAIITVINLINSGKSNWKYAVTECNAFSNPCFIVYFETRVDGEKIQISFHTFSDMKKYVKRSFRTKWDHGDSRDSAEKAYHFFVKNGRYSW